MFYTMNLILSLLFLIELGFLRSGIYAKLRLSKHSKSYIRKNTKGFLNYWTYKQINKEHPLGAIYYINIIYMLSFLIFTLVALCVGFLDYMKIPILCISVVTAVIGMVCTIYASIYCSRADYEKKLVLLAKAKNQSKGKLFSSLFEWLLALAPFFVIYLNFFY